MTSTAATSYQAQRGLGLAFIGGFTISFDIPLIRLAGSDPYLVMGLRGLALCLVLWLYWRFWADRSHMPRALLSDPYFITVGALSGLNNICFTFAVFYTSTANVVFILAFNPMLAALFSWPLTGERPSLATWAAIFTTLLGVAIIVSSGFGGGHFLGDVFSLICATTLALSLTLARRSNRDLSLAPGYGGAISSVFALPMIVAFSTLPQAPVWIIFDAFVLVPIAGITLWLAPRFIPAPQVALFYLLETTLTPLWVWYVFNETPELNVFIGGTIVVLAITAHAIWELKKHKNNKKMQNQTHINKQIITTEL